MEEKARLYAAMKRGDYVDPRAGSTSTSAYNSDERAPLVDFDRKWAEAETAGEASVYNTSSDDGFDSEEERREEEEELVEYTDEFGRSRRGTRGEVAREERRRRLGDRAAKELDEMAARPQMPANVIRGNTIQTAAFVPDAGMQALAAKRDRSVTPPQEVHYDASKEVRSKGVGFYAFSGEKGVREREMKALEREREETERTAREREERREKKARELEERKRKVKEKRGVRQADDFLKGLEMDIGNAADGTSRNEIRQEREGE